MPVHYLCECGRPANWSAKNRGGKVTGARDHDLCRRCFRKLMDAARKEEDEREQKPDWWDRRLFKVTTT